NILKLARFPGLLHTQYVSENGCLDIPPNESKTFCVAGWTQNHIVLKFIDQPGIIQNIEPPMNFEFTVELRVTGEAAVPDSIPLLFKWDNQNRMLPAERATQS
ncbi:MAG: hypothetical protein JWM99_1425, partial [Verrucomicrobiales bacterium]|nr:hypothetical protein [Verrucomicrobiales bacterium]